MKILIITQLYPEPDDIGDNRPTRTVEYFAKEWVMMGHEVKVIHCPSKFPLVLYYVPKWIKDNLGGASSNIIPSIESRKRLFRNEYGIDIARFPMFKMFPGMGYSNGKMKKQAKIIEEYLLKHKFAPDIVVGHFANPSTALTAILSEYYNAKSSIVFHNDCNKKNVKRHRLDKWVEMIGAVGSRNVTEAQEIKKLLKLKKMPFLCCSGVPNDAVKMSRETCDKMDFSKGIKYLFVGSLIKRKNLEAVMQAFDEETESKDLLIIVGGGPDEERIKKYRESLKNKENVIFTGRVPREEVLAKMRDAHVFTLISDGETYGMVYAEAMLQGCITIASREG